MEVQLRRIPWPEKINHNNYLIESLELILNGEKEVCKVDQLVSSIPITELLKILDPLPSKEVLDAAKKLTWRSQVYMFITLNKSQLTKDNWIYFPEKKFPFGRISEMKNFSMDMSPSDKTSLMIEFFVTEGDAIWNMKKEDLFKMSLPYFNKLNLFQEEDIRSIYVFKKKNVYPIYDLNYEQNLTIIKAYLDKFENLQYIGRPGRFRYTNQDHSLESGILAAKNILEGKKYDLDLIGTEKSYFEDVPLEYEKDE